MKKMIKHVSLLAFFTLTSAVYAQDNSNPYLPDAKLTAHSASTWNVGVGITQKILHLNTEWVNPYGIAYVKAGVFIDDDYTPAAQIGFRYPYHLTGKDSNGYYVGVYAGHIESKNVDNAEKARLGGGIDLAYVLLSTERISTFSVGIGAGEKLEDSAGNVVADIQPRLQFSYTLSIGL